MISYRQFLSASFPEIERNFCRYLEHILIELNIKYLSFIHIIHYLLLNIRICMQATNKFDPSSNPSSNFINWFIRHILSINKKS